MVLESTAILLVANSTPIVDFDSILYHENRFRGWTHLNSFRVNRLNKLDFPKGGISLHVVAYFRDQEDIPTPESPISTTIHDLSVYSSVTDVSRIIPPTSNYGAIPLNRKSYSSSRDIE